MLVLIRFRTWIQDHFPLSLTLRDMAFYCLLSNAKCSKLLVAAAARRFVSLSDLNLPLI